MSFLQDYKILKFEHLSLYSKNTYMSTITGCWMNFEVLRSPNIRCTGADLLQGGP